MDLQVKVVGSGDGAKTRSLYNWLMREDDLRASRVNWLPAQPGPEEMGTLSDVLVVSMGAGGVGVALIQSLMTWLHTQGSDVRLKLSGPHGEMEVDAKRVRDPAALADHLQSIVSGG
jgi:hypothetical protein